MYAKREHKLDAIVHYRHGGVIFHKERGFIASSTGQQTRPRVQPAPLLSRAPLPPNSRSRCTSTLPAPVAHAASSSAAPSVLSQARRSSHRNTQGSERGDGPRRSHRSLSVASHQSNSASTGAPAGKGSATKHPCACQRALETQRVFPRRDNHCSGYSTLRENRVPLRPRLRLHHECRQRPGGDVQLHRDSQGLQGMVRGPDVGPSRQDALLRQSPRTACPGTPRCGF